MGRTLSRIALGLFVFWASYQFKDWGVVNIVLPLATSITMIGLIVEREARW